MSISITIDTREHDLISLFDEKEINKKQLDIGDILFTKGDKEIAVIERKTDRDFRASLRDGRYREQKKRLEACCKAKGMIVIYLIEGYYWNKPTKYEKVSNDQMLGAFVSTMIKSEFHVYHVKDINQSKDLINKVKKKLGEIGDKSKEIDYVETLKVVKGANVSSNDAFVLMLNRIPGVSMNIAKELNKKYKSIGELAKDENALDELKKIKINNRAINSNTLKKIVEWIN